MTIRRHQTENPLLSLLKTLPEKSEVELEEEKRKISDLYEQEVRRILSSPMMRQNIAMVVGNTGSKFRFFR